MSKRLFMVLASVLVGVLGVCTVALTVRADREQEFMKELQEGEVEMGGTWYPIEEHIIPTVTETESKEPEARDEYEGFVFYQIPDEYKREGAKLQAQYQKYLWKLCKKRKIDYYILLALIEQESGYNSSAIGDSGESVGYLQIQERWHSEVMEDLGVDSLYNPKGNLNVGTKLLQNIYKEYGDRGDHCVFMVYNMGSPRAKELWERGIHSTEYSRQVLKRSKQIEQELAQDKQDDKG